MIRVGEGIREENEGKLTNQKHRRAHKNRTKAAQQLEEKYNINLATSCPKDANVDGAW